MKFPGAHAAAWKDAPGKRSRLVADLWIQRRGHRPRAGGGGSGNIRALCVRRNSKSDRDRPEPAERPFPWRNMEPVRANSGRQMAGFRYPRDAQERTLHRPHHLEPISMGPLGSGQQTA